MFRIRNVRAGDIAQKSGRKVTVTALPYIAVHGEMSKYSLYESGGMFVISFVGRIHIPLMKYDSLAQM